MLHPVTTWLEGPPIDYVVPHQLMNGPTRLHGLHTGTEYEGHACVMQAVSK
jgi:hypothetical protein